MTDLSETQSDNQKQKAEAVFEKAVNQHLQSIRQKIEAKAVELADGEPPSLIHLARAAELFAPGNEIHIPPIVEKRHFFDFFPPIAVLYAILTCVFAALGLWALLGAPEAAKTTLNNQGFLDIAKIFAGAIAGSTTTAITSTLKKGKI
jgi:hypothetical protein